MVLHKCIEEVIANLNGMKQKDKQSNRANNCKSKCKNKLSRWRTELGKGKVVMLL